MKKDELNNRFREHVRAQLTPTTEERELVAKVYDSVKSALDGNCFQVGSFARFTAARPIHDLDILFICGRFDPSSVNPQGVLDDLDTAIKSNFVNPTKYAIRVLPQTHSITISFYDGSKEVFATDIVPAFTAGLKNVYGEDIYWVPEILRSSRRNRATRYEEFSRTKKSEVEWWIRSDPRGYIAAASDLNARNADFRKATKFIKRWKHNCKRQNEEFKLKSFHIEQVVFEIFSEQPHLEIFDAVFKFFCDLPQAIERPRITDRADQAKHVDEYLNSVAIDLFVKGIACPEYLFNCRPGIYSEAVLTHHRSTECLDLWSGPENAKSTEN